MKLTAILNIIEGKISDDFSPVYELRNSFLEQIFSNNHYKKKTIYAPESFYNTISLSLSEHKCFVNKSKSSKSFVKYMTVNEWEIYARSCKNPILICDQETWDYFSSRGNIDKIYLMNYSLTDQIKHFLISDDYYKKSTEFQELHEGVTINNNIKWLLFNIDMYYPKTLSFESQYLRLIEKILDSGIMEASRNGNCLTTYHSTIQVDLKKGFPIITARKSFWKGICEELLWFISGSSNTGDLAKRGVNIWNANSSATFLASQGLKLSEGDIGPSYGFQMRYSGAKYVNCNTNYHGQGIDQLQECINTITKNPTSRRIIINLWDASEISQMALPPCAFLYQFTVSQGHLSCHLYQRSWDVMLGWNTSTAALLTYILADFTGLKPGILTHTVCCAHIYESHIVSARKLYSQNTFPLPQLKIKSRKRDSINDYCFDDFELIDYQHGEAIKMTMIA